MDDYGEDLPIHQVRNRRQTNGQNVSSHFFMDYESDTDIDDSELSTIDEEDEMMDSSDTSDDDVWYNGGVSGDGNLSDASSDSSLNSSYNGEGASSDIFELMSQHLDMFNHDADSFFRVSLRTLYETLMEFMQEKNGPTPHSILQALPTFKVTLAQIAANAPCAICFAEYEQEEDLIKLPCNHDYHKDCIQNWLKIKSTCPTCRLDIVKSHNERVREHNVDDINLSDIDSLLITSNNTSEETINTDASEGHSASSSTDNLHSSSENSTSSVISLASTSSGETMNELGVFSRGTSPISIEEIETIPGNVKENINTMSSSSSPSSTSPQGNKRQTDTTMTSHLPAKRKSKETEIW